MDQKIEIRGKVCVTGASGYLASWLVKRLLLSGYHVIGTVRNPGSEKSAFLWQLEGAKERLKLVKADLMKEGSFDDAIMGCDGVFHIASPVWAPNNSDAKAEILDPAIKGTLNVLNSCKKSPSVKRVVLTSSTAALRARHDIDPNIPLDESSWSSIEVCETLQLWYPLAKTLAEKAAWEFAKENKLDLVTVLPSYVIGPCLPLNISSTASQVLDLLKGDTTNFSKHGRLDYVHIDDVALTHIRVYEDKSATGRYLCCSTILESNELASFLSKRYPSLPNIPKRFDPPVIDKPYFEMNTSKIKSLGIKFKSIEEMFDNLVETLKEQGHI